ncbi:MAG: hypothetical protein SOX69_04400 [Oscillospiraceae bacterium]|nr:hypothetical protein [Oscillospiraceae bacterium]
MLKTLLKKQLFEFGRAFVYDEKNKKARSKVSSITFIVLYFVLIFGLLGGFFTYLSFSVCTPLSESGAGWLYYVMLGLIGTALGTFGSVFNTHATLYAAKDNDLLLSMPIPEKYIVISRLSSVYILGTVFSVVVTLPAVTVGFIRMKQSVLSVIGGILFIVTVSAIVLILSCVLGFFVAKISAKLKNKSFITVLASLIFFAAYYLIYFKANDVIKGIVANASSISEKIKISAYPLYFFGKMGTGDLLSIAVCVASAVGLAVFTCFVIARSFRKTVTAPASQARLKGHANDIKQGSVGFALFRKEFKRFTSSPNYMLNCALGVVFILASGIVFIVKGRIISDFITFSMELDGTYVSLAFLCILCIAASMNDTAAAAVSLEGKSIWILQSLPVFAKDVLKAKLLVQLAVTCPPLLVGSVCAVIAAGGSVATAVMLIIFPQCFAFTAACFDLFVNLKSPNLNWTNEIVPIKQSLGIMIAMFGGFIYAAGFGLSSYFALMVMPVEAVFAVSCAVTLAIGIIIYRWICKKGALIFSTL